MFITLPKGVANMSDVLQGVGVLVIVFLMLMILGLQVQITGASRKLDEIIDKLNSKKPD